MPALASTAETVGEREPAVHLRPLAIRKFSSQSQGSLTDSAQRHSWAPTDLSHGAVTSESHPSKRPLLGRSQSSGVGADQRMPLVPQANELGVRHARAKLSSWDEDAHRRRRVSQTIKVALELLIAAWVVYSAVRYFIGFTVYTSAHDRRIITSVLGSISLLSFGLSLLSLFLITLSPSPSNSLLGLLLEYALATFALTPAVANLILVFVWRDASDAQETLNGRCRWDIDVSWTGTGNQCQHGPGFGVFIAAASVRLALTLLVLLGYLIASHAFRWTPSATQEEFTFRPSRQTVVSQALTQDSRAQLVSRLSSSTPVPTTTTPRTPRNLLADEFPGEVLAPRPDSTTPMGYVRPDLAPLTYPPVPHSTPADSFSATVSMSDDEARLRRRTADMELIQFAAQFRSLVHQMQQDVAAGALSGDDSTPGTDADGVTPLSEGEEDYGFPAAGPSQQSRPPHGAGVTQMPVPTPDRDRMRLMLGQLVRRMPTIESLGSREREAQSIHRAPYSASTSRPPTRLTMRSDGSMSSAPPSRSNSLTLGRAMQGGALPTPPTPASMEAGYFPSSGRASPSPLMALPPRGGTLCPSRPPTPRTPSPTATSPLDPLPPALPRAPPP